MQLIKVSQIKPRNILTGKLGGREDDTCFERLRKTMKDFIKENHFVGKDPNLDIANTKQ
jgi:hypothetical protein